MKVSFLEKTENNIAKQKDKKETAALKEKSVTAAPAILPDNSQDCVVKQRTFGNKLYDWLIYGSVSWAGVSAASLLTVHEAHHGTKPSFNWLRNLNTKFTETLSENVFSKIFKSPAKVKAWSSGTAMFWMLGLGGSALSPILKYLEDNRQKISSKIDNMFGTTPPDPELVAQEPKQSWLSVGAGRFASVATGYLSFCAMGPKVADSVSKWCGEHATNMYMKWKPKANPVKVRRVADIAVFDIFFTMVTASATYLISRFVAKRTDNIKDDDCEPAKPAIMHHSHEHETHTHQHHTTKMAKPASYTENVIASQNNHHQLAPAL